MKNSWIDIPTCRTPFAFAKITSILVSVLTLFSVASAAEGVCPIYKCSLNVADKDPQIGRLCAKYNSTSTTDICSSSNQCFSGNACKDGVCTGKPLNSKCDKSKECDVGLYCLNSVCTALKARNSAVDVSKDEQCIFGTLPDSNGKCSPFGTVFIGSKVPDKDSENLCSRFYADKGTKDTAYYFPNNYYCTYPPNLTVEDFFRPDPNKLDCNYTWYESDTGNKGWKIQYARCGMNQKSSHVCPKYKGEFDFVHQVNDYITMWNNTFKCHVESNQLYCKDVHDKGYRKLMADWLKDTIETISEDSYAQYANNDECTKAIFNREYWQIISEINSSYMMSAIKSMILFAGFILFIS